MALPVSHTTSRSPQKIADDVQAALMNVGDPDRAIAMAAYMKGIAPFFGVAAPLRRSTTKDLRNEAASLDEPELFKFVAACFKLAERECHYVALDTLDKRKKTISEDSLCALKTFITTKSWWDTVDGIAPIVGAGAIQFSSWRDELDSWAIAENMWIRRISILYQNHFKANTDVERLFRIILLNASDSEFFIRKAIGWALRELAWRQPVVVRDFVNAHRDQLSPLSIREALKNTL
jgi:3-methyladenine DNA glycosylase AlkD